MHEHVPISSILMVRFMKPNEKELAISTAPNITINVTISWWYEKNLVSSLMSDPPTKYPPALARKMKEK